MKILILSAEVWRYDTNGGSVLSNVLEGLNAELAQVYCNPGQPANRLCKRYYQMTDKMVLQNILTKTPVGQSFFCDNYPMGQEKPLAQSETITGFGAMKKSGWMIFHIARELIWKLGKWDNEQLKKFIVDFDPDMIFAPCYASHRMLRLTRWVGNLTKKPIVSYISDDGYSLRQFRFSPLYWIDRLVLRSNMRKTFPYYKLVYTMTEEQKAECERDFGANMKVLRKAGVATTDGPRDINSPLRLIFAGGIYCGRWKTLAAIAKILKEINQSGVKAELHIYTGNVLNKKQKKVLDDKCNSYVHGLVPPEKLKAEYGRSDVALHVESFDRKNRLLTRLSFSTKIVDCLESGCAVLAIAWKHHAGLCYLEREDAAVCVSERARLKETICELVDNPQKVQMYQEKASACILRNHRKEKNQEMLQKDFEEIIHESSTNKRSL